MIRVTIDLVPFGIESHKKTIGLIEIANKGTGTSEKGNYGVVLKKTPPWAGALKLRWKAGNFSDDKEALTGDFGGFSRTRRGVYDLLFCALRACGIDKRNE